jgi:two-component system CheB/CheR fusion protein
MAHQHDAKQGSTERREQSPMADEGQPAVTPDGIQPGAAAADAAAPHRPEMTVVGIGASAGGLKAIKTLLGGLPDNTGLAYVVVVHLAPEHKSHMADLLQPACRMPVQQVTETTELKRDHVYVIPPGANLNTIDTHLRLSELEEKRVERATIDHFLRTLAATHDGHAVGVILTGTGTDGTLGLREIKEAGGLTIAQDPGEADYDGMPRAAIDAGAVDLILPLARMPEHIVGFARTKPKVETVEGEKAASAEAPLSEPKRLLQRIFAQLRTATGRDFSPYKRTTVMRRIRRRMQLHSLEDLQAYLEMLRKDHKEAKQLADDLLITVTRFFRDAETFHLLEREVIPRLFEDKGPDDHVRVWSVGCSTGEEAYSLAMLLLEEAARRKDPPQIQIFASDLHETALKQAREGVYPETIHENVSQERLRKFFRKVDSSYRIRKQVRELIVFAPHNLLHDPPFAHLDFVSCRNLLIYLQREAQRDVISLLHYALRPEGLLLLGGSEAVDRADLFTPEDKSHCLYRRRNVPVRDLRLVQPPRQPNAGVETASESESEEGEQEDGPPGRVRRMHRPPGYGQLHERMVERYAPPSLLLSDDHSVVHYSVNAGRYLELTGGEPTSNVYKLIREPLRTELRTALYAVRGKRTHIRSRPISVEIEGEERRVVMHVRAAEDGQLGGFYLVVFDEVDGGERGGAPGGEADVDAHVRELETELDLTKQRLRTAIEEYETSQEEMQTSYEELQSANEELRSTMEELETSKEELQSTNEELTTVNQENRHRVEELSQLSADLQNLLAATEIATLFLDRDLRISRFTPRVTELFNIRPSDCGRPLSDLTHRLNYAELQQDGRRVLERLVPVEREIRSEQGTWFLTRILPYRTAEDKIDGVVITFIDITDRKEAERELAGAKEYAESIVETLPDPLLVLKDDLRVKTANAAFYEHFQVEREETVGRKIYDLGNGQWDIPELRRLLEDILPDDNVFNDYKVRHEFEDLGERVMLINGRRLDHVQLILLGIRDITGDG